MSEPKTRLEVRGLNGKASGHVQLPEELFTGSVNKTLLYEANRMYEARKRRGTASTKTRAEVSGGGAKPWRQKGTGRARVGSSRNPIWRHGGVAFGPKPRDFGFKMPKKAVRRALLSMLNVRLKEGAILPVEKIALDEPKTRAFRKILDELKINDKTLVAVDTISEELKRATSNLADITVKEARNINARDVLLNRYLLIEKDAITKLIERVK